MIEGIEILNQYVVNISPLGWLALIPGIILTIVCIGFGTMAFIDNYYGPGAALLALAVPCCLLIGVGVALFKTPPETRYDVIVSENVSMTEFYEKYEIIEQNGKIFTIREKTQ